MLTQMAKYLDTVYVSGWQCSSTASSTDEPSPDLADYPMVCRFQLEFSKSSDNCLRIPYQIRYNISLWLNFSTTANNERNVSPPLKQVGRAWQIPTS